MDRLLITSSRVKTYRLCQRKHKFKYVDLLESKKRPEALDFGSLLHASLEAWWDPRWSPGDGDDRLIFALDALDKFALGGASPPAHVMRFFLEAGRSMIIAYHLRWKNAPWKPIAVEAEFTFEVEDPVTGEVFVVAGKVDALAEFIERGGALYVVEHKTSKEDLDVTAPYWRRLRFDTQVSTYFRGGERIAAGRAIEGCLYDVLAKPDSPMKATPVESRQYTIPVPCKLHKAQKRDVVPDCERCKPGRLYARQRVDDETPEEYGKRVSSEGPQFARQEVIRLRQELDDSLADTLATARQIRLSIVQNSHPRNESACHSFGRECEYFPICAGEATSDDPRYVRKTTAHSELSAATQGATHGTAGAVGGDPAEEHQPVTEWGDGEAPGAASTFDFGDADEASGPGWTDDWFEG